jgi:hypothetical protein
MLNTALRLLRSAPAKAAPSQPLPFLGGLSWVYLYAGQPERFLEFEERNVASGYQITSILWNGRAAQLRKTERFKTLLRKSGVVDYWKARGWPDLCHPTTGDDFACD